MLYLSFHKGTVWICGPPKVVMWTKVTLRISMSQWTVRDNPLSRYEKERRGVERKSLCLWLCLQIWACPSVSLGTEVVELVVFPVTERSVPVSATPEQFMARLSCQDITRILSSSQFEKFSVSWLGSPAQEGHKFVEESPEKGRKDSLRAGVLVWGNAGGVGVV